MRIRWAALILAPILLFADSADRWWSYVEFLASDALQGRNTGSAGYQQAADFVAAQFQQAGLKPAGDNGSFFQSISFLSKQLDESQSTLSLRGPEGTRQLKLGEDAIISTRIDPAPNVDAELVFVGYGEQIPEQKYHDFAHLDTKGRIAVYLAGAPPGMPGEVASHYQATAQRWAAMKSAGIVGLISIADPNHMDIPWERTAANRLQPTMQLADSSLNDAAGAQLAVGWNPAHADELFAGTGYTFAEIVDDAEHGRPLPHFTINARIQARTVVRRASVQAPNVIAVLPGQSKSNEYVVLSAHLDHLGASVPLNDDAIFNGAMDNASGVASLIEIAHRLAESGKPLKRSVLFIALTGEEKGLLGSRYFAAHPTVQAKNMVADLNVDMFLPLYPLHMLTVYGLGESTLGDDARAVAAASGLSAHPDPEPQLNYFIRSDQYNFTLRGVPSIMVDIGYEKGSPEEAKVKEWMATRYHARTDDLSQPIDRDAAAEFNDVLVKLTTRVANDSRRPEWKRDSFFRRFAK